MSFESACEFLEKLKNDKKFAEKISKCKNIKEKKSVLLQEGFKFTQEELSIVKEDY